jgi:hypothetical protein
MIRVWVLGSMVSLACAAAAVAQEAAAPSLLEQLDRETQRLHESVQASVVRVQLPPPKWVEEMLASDHPAQKWKDLDPQVKNELQQKGRGAIIIPPATQPAAGATTQPSDDAWRVTPNEDESVTIESRIEQGDSRMLIVKQRGGDNGGMQVEARRSSTFQPNNIAIVLDEAGHLLVPIYLEREQLTRPITVSAGPEQLTTATFVGSDRQTGLTVLRCEKPIGRPARLASDARPAAGSLVMILSPSNDSARLSIWNASANDWGVVVRMNGSIAGFARHGQFLGGGLTKPVVQQLIEKGSVQRPTLGMVIAEVRADDAVRRQHSALGSRPAMHVRQVMENSPAARAGIQPGDLILALDGREVGDIPSFAAAVAQCGAEAKLTVLRAGAEEHLIVRFDQK